MNTRRNYYLRTYTTRSRNPIYLNQGDKVAIMNPSGTVKTDNQGQIITGIIEGKFIRGERNIALIRLSPRKHTTVFEERLIPLSR